MKFYLYENRNPVAENRPAVFSSYLNDEYMMKTYRYLGSIDTDNYKIVNAKTKLNRNWKEVNMRTCFNYELDYIPDLKDGEIVMDECGFILCKGYGKDDVPLPIIGNEFDWNFVRASTNSLSDKYEAEVLTEFLREKYVYIEGCMRKTLYARNGRIIGTYCYKK